MINWRGGIKVVMLLAITIFSLFEFTLYKQSDVFREFEASLRSLQWMFLVCLAVWFGTFLFLKFSWNDLPLSGLLLFAMAAFFIGYPASWQVTDVAILLVGVTLGKGARLFLQIRRPKEKSEENSEVGMQTTEVSPFMVGLTTLLAFAAYWHLNMSDNSYHGPRWMGLWNNPNVYGMLMGGGVTLAIGLVVEKRKAGKRESENEEQSGKRAEAERRHRNRLGKSGEAETDTSPRPSPHLAPLPPPNAEREKRSPRLWQYRSLSSYRLLQIFLVIAVFMMGVGLVCSYSRGAWLGTAVGLLYLAWSYGKLKWKWVVAAVAVAVIVVMAFWGRTPDSAPWYVKRLDFGRPSAQHRVSAWRGALHMMWDHPFGVGWNNAQKIYEKNYSPPENGAAAIETNDYLMLGTQLGWPGLICFVTYAGLCLRRKNAKCKMQNEVGSKSGKRESGKAETGEMENAECRMQNEEAGKAEGGKRESGNGADMVCCPPSPVSSPPGRGLLRSQRLWNLLRGRLKKGSQMVDGKSGKAKKGEDEDEHDDEDELPCFPSEGEWLRIACRAGAVVFLVAFWFDGGLFTLATGAVFWVLLELGVEPRMDTNKHQ